MGKIEHYVKNSKAFLNDSREIRNEPDEKAALTRCQPCSQKLEEDQTLSDRKPLAPNDTI